METWMRPFRRWEVVEHWRIYRQECNMLLFKRKELLEHPQRFGQWWWNQYGGKEALGIDSCPEIFYEQNDRKALDKIVDKFGRVG